MIGINSVNQAKARRDYLKIIQNKRPSIRKRRRCIREQLQYIRRNSGHILALLDCPSCPLFRSSIKDSDNTGLFNICISNSLVCIKISAKSVMIALKRLSKRVIFQGEVNTILVEWNKKTNKWRHLLS